MNATRREFLKYSVATGGLVSWGMTVPTFLSRTALAAPFADKKGAKDTILVVVQLTGGNDGLNTVVPFADPEYAKLRPTLKLPKDQLKKVNDQIGLHPSLEGLAKLLQDQSLCIVQGPLLTLLHCSSMNTGRNSSSHSVTKSCDCLPMIRCPRLGHRLRFPQILEESAIAFSLALRCPGVQGGKWGGCDFHIGLP